MEQALHDKKNIEQAILTSPGAIDANTPLNELISTIAQSPCAVPVIGDNQRYIGVISKGILLQALDKETING